MTHASVVDVLTGKYAVGTTQTVKGWIRTRRDSKAGNAADQICQFGACRFFGGGAQDDNLRDPALCITAQCPCLLN